MMIVEGNAPTTRAARYLKQVLSHFSHKIDVELAEDLAQDALVAALDPEGWQGPVPHTVLIAPGGKVIYRESGAVDRLKLKRAIVEHIGRTYASTPEKAHPKNAR